MGDKERQQGGVSRWSKRQVEAGLKGRQSDNPVPRTDWKAYLPPLGGRGLVRLDNSRF
jgi:hypothetical protein